MKRFNDLNKRVGMVAAVLAAASMALPAVAETTTSIAEERAAAEAELARKVRRELVMLPYYGVFDHFAFRLDQGVVTLMGQVSRPTLRSDAANVVKRLEGVVRVNNEIEVLPLSNFDDRIRVGVFRAIYWQSSLQRYAAGVQPSIRILVKNGVVTLEGVVLNEADRNIAFMQANGVAGVFEVRNHLRTEKRTSKI